MANDSKPTGDKSQRKKRDTAILVAIIGLIGTVITVIFNSPVLIELLNKSPAPTQETAEAALPPTQEPSATNPLPSATATVTPSLTPTVSSTPEADIPIAGVLAGAASPLDNLIIEDNWIDYFILDSDSLTDSSFLFSDDFPKLVLPENIDPSEDPDKALSQIAAQLTTFGIENVPWDHLVNWATYDLNLSNIEGDNHFPISIDNEAKIRITSFTPKNEHVNVISVDYIFIPVTGGGSGVNLFSPVSLDPQNWEIEVFTSQFLESEFIKIEPGDFQFFEFSIHCTSPGTYTFSIEIFASALGETKTLGSETPFTLNCPETITMWSVSQGYENIERVGTYKLTNWEYILQDE